MQCPKCGTENPDDAQICSACGYVFENDATKKPVAKPKTSKLAIASFVLSVLSLPLFLLAAIPALVLGIISIFKIRKSSGQLKGKRLAIAGVSISTCFIVIFFLWCVDAAPIPDDYTIADLRSARPEYAESYELLNTLNEQEENPKGAPAIGLSEQDVSAISQVSDVIKEGDYSKITKLLKANAANINQAWKNGQKGRDIISQLNTFPEIADLTEPDMDAKIGFFRNLKHLSRLYQAYAYLQSEQGNGQIAVDKLIELDSVLRKLSINARSIITKLVCYGGLNTGISTANFIINNPQTSQESLELLSGHFTPLTNEQISLRNPFISEYLMFKRILDTMPSLKPNSTSRLAKNFWEDWIAAEGKPQQPKNEKLSVWPSICPDWLPVSIDSEGKLPWFYTVYNPIGSFLVGILTPAWENVVEYKTKLKVRDDLFQIVLNKRLGKEISLKARAYSDEYIIDIEQKKIFSPGPDGKADTKDDIKLTINPEVLNLTD